MAVQTVIDRATAVGVKVGVAARRRNQPAALFHVLGVDQVGTFATCTNTDAIERAPGPSSRWCQPCLRELAAEEADQQARTPHPDPLREDHPRP